MSKLPFIIMFDIDEAIIGKIGHCIDEKYLLNIIMSKCKDKDALEKCSEIKLDFREELEGGLLRPNLKNFVDFCNEQYKNVELFVYTNSSHGWVHGGLVENIEKASGLKFNKPYFTREYSSNRMGKRIAFAYDDIIKTLEKKYPLLSKSDKHKETVFTNRFIFIDDVPNNLDDLVSKQIVCTKYKYKPYYDIVRKLINKYQIDEKFIDIPDVLKFCYENDIPYFSKNGNKFQKDEMFISSQHILHLNTVRISNSVKDTFFLDLIKIMKKIPNMSDKNINKINNNIQKLNASLVQII